MNEQLKQDGTMLALNENNRLLEVLKGSVNRLAIVGILFFFLCVWLIAYTIRNNVINNIVARCV